MAKARCMAALERFGNHRKAAWLQSGLWTLAAPG
jgi:hypothetical protein